MSARDWRKLYQQYRGQWVALEQDQVTVIAAAPTLKEVRAKALELGNKSPHFTKMPKDLRIFVG